MGEEGVNAQCDEIDGATGRTPRQTGEHGSPLVLLVETDAALRGTLRLALEARGYGVLEAPDGRRALEIVERHQPRLVVQELELPDVDGLSFIEQVRSRPGGARIPIVGLAGRHGLDEVRAARLGLMSVLFKPVEAAHLLQVVRAQLAHRETPRRAPPEPEAPSPSCRSAMRNAQLAVLARTSASLAQGGTVHQVLSEALTICLDIVGISCGALYLHDPETGEQVLAQQVGIAPAELACCFASGVLLAEVRRSGEVLSIPSPSVPEEAGRCILEQLRTDSALLVPLAWADRMYGLLVLGARGTGLLAAESIAFARLMATHVAQALALEATLRQLRRSESRYRTIMDHAHDAICTVDERGHLLEANRRFEALTGRRDLVGRHMDELAVPGEAEANRRKLDEAMARGNGVSEGHIQCADGTTVAMEFSTAAIDLDGERVAICIGRDVTEQQRTQAQLMVSDRMASVGMLAAGVAHEINNPLAAVLANLELATKDVADLTGRPGALGELGEELADAHEGARRVHAIVRDLKIFSRAEEDKLGLVDVVRVIESSARMAWNELRHRAHLVQRFTPVPPVLVNESRLGQVILNLIVNAAQAIPEGHADQNEIRLATSLEHGRVLIEVTDTGSGMPPEVLARLFTPFFTTKPAGVGTGLGLSICQRIVAQAGGEIRIESRVGQGTTFKVFLPAASGQVMTHPVNPVAMPAATGARGRLLVVDDDPLLVRLVHRLLSPEHDVTTVVTAQEAYDLVCAGERFGVILCDVMMPRMSGMELHEALTRAVPEQAARMVFITGGAFTPRAHAFLDEIPNARLNKPFDGDELRQLVAERLAGGA